VYRRLNEMIKEKYGIEIEDINGGRKEKEVDDCRD
jgi:hypothetical protein